MPALESLPPAQVRAIELVTVTMPLVTPLVTAAGATTSRSVLLVHVLAEEAEGWAECATLSAPTYSPEFTGAAAAVLQQHVVPLACSGPTGDALALHGHLQRLRGHHVAKATLELAVLDAQLRAADRSLAGWLGATVDTVPGGAALGLHQDPDDLIMEADTALTAGAARLRVKIAPGRAAKHLEALRAHVGADCLLQADANGSFQEDDPELDRIDAIGLACLEQPLSPEDLLGHARLADRLHTPICLDEPLTSLGVIEAAIALGACEVVCLKPARVGGWVTARHVYDRCQELGVPVWVGGMLETGVGRAANVAVAALPGMALPPDLDPRSRYSPDLVVALDRVDGGVVVPQGPGTGAVPDPALLSSADTVEVLTP